MLLKACLNGARTPAEHPALPVTPPALAKDATRVVAAGAGALHVHPKDPRGLDTLDGDPVAAAVSAVRTAVPTTPVGVTTGAWTTDHPDERVRAIRSWSTLPDFASVNWHEPGADEVAEALLERGIGVEAGLWDTAGLEAWSSSPHHDECCRILIELPDGIAAAAAIATADRMVQRVRSIAPGTPILLHGEGTTCWQLLRHATRQGLQTRVGLEDVLVLPDGSAAPDNAALVAAARAMIERSKAPPSVWS